MTPVIDQGTNGTEKDSWKIKLKHPMWNGWKTKVRMYGVTREEAVGEAIKAAIYFDGATKWKVTRK